MLNIPSVPGSSIENFTAVTGNTNVFTLKSPAISVNHITAVEAFEFDIIRIGGPTYGIDLISKKPMTGNHPLRLWLVDFGLTDKDQVTNTFTVDLVDDVGNSYSEVFFRTGNIIPMPLNTAAIKGIHTTLGVLPWTYRIGNDVHVYAMGVVAPLDTTSSIIPTPPVPDGTVYHFSGSTLRRLALGDDYVVDELGRIKVLTTLTGSSEVVIDYNFVLRSALTGW